MQVKQHALARQIKYYSTTAFKYEWMLEQLPVFQWLELSKQFEDEHHHSARLFVEEHLDYENTTFELVQDLTPPHSRNFCNETKWAIKTQSHDKFCSKCGCELPKFEGEEE